MIIRRIVKIILKTALIVLLLVFTILLVRAFDARRMPPLMVWHEATLQAEYDTDHSPPLASLSDYLSLEKRLFQELDEKVY